MFIVRASKIHTMRADRHKKEPEKNPSSGDSKKKHDQENRKMCGMMRQGGDTV